METDAPPPQPETIAQSRPSTYDFDLICIGSGSAGTTTANLARQDGHRVAVVEAGPIGGECPNYGCIPTKAALRATSVWNQTLTAPIYGIEANRLHLNYKKVIAYKDQVVANTIAAQGQEALTSLGITVIKGSARFLNPWIIDVGGRHYSSRRYLIATGAATAVPPIVGIESVPYMTSRTILDLNRPPASLFIIGAGAVGCEFADFFRACKTRVQIADRADRLLNSEDIEVSHVVNKIFSKTGIKTHTDTAIDQITAVDNRYQVLFHQGAKQQKTTVDQILVATGKSPTIDSLNLSNANVSVDETKATIKVNKYMQTSQKHIYAAGDVAGPHRFTHMAIYQAGVVAHNLWRRRKRYASYRAVPRCIFVTPEVAAVGPGETELKNRGQAYKKAITPIQAVGRANTSNQRTGFVKIITSPKGQVLGGSIIAPRAGEMIHEIALAVKADLHVRTIAETIHAFPTWSEAVKLTARQLI